MALIQKVRGKTLEGESILRVCDTPERIAEYVNANDVTDHIEIDDRANPDLLKDLRENTRDYDLVAGVLKKKGLDAVVEQDSDLTAYRKQAKGFVTAVKDGQVPSDSQVHQMVALLLIHQFGDEVE